MRNKTIQNLQRSYRQNSSRDDHTTSLFKRHPNKEHPKTQKPPKYPKLRESYDSLVSLFLSMWRRQRFSMAPSSYGTVPVAVRWPGKGKAQTKEFVPPPVVVVALPLPISPGRAYSGHLAYLQLLSQKRLLGLASQRADGIGGHVLFWRHTYVEQ